MAIGIVAGDLHHGRFDVRIIHIADGQRGGNGYRAIILGVGQGRAFDRGLDRSVVGVADRPGESARGGGTGSIIDREVKTIAAGLAAVVIVADQPGHDVGLGKGVGG